MVFVSLPDRPRSTTSSDAELSYADLRLGVQVDGERHHPARTDFGQ
jgi:hypothetical protein